ncbi:MAG: hypothetical protein F6J93_19275 [Oscillatoria sp. SIO1A7]|nr:hypothetical protein [Oscillatoria sp. SIO1A7]
MNKLTKLNLNSAVIKHTIAGLLLALGLLTTGTGRASAFSIKATLTADNNYGLYYGEADGSGLTFVGRNERGDSHIPDTTLPVPPSPCSGAEWSCPEAWEFDMDADYIYVVAWDDESIESWIGEFETPEGLLLSNASDWEYTIGGANPGANGDLPSLTDVTAEIANGSWATPRSFGSNGSSLWGTIPDISGSAEFIWSKNANNSNYVVFRTAVNTRVPEPSVVFGLLAFGAYGAASQIIKRKRQ